MTLGQPLAKHYYHGWALDWKHERDFTAMHRRNAAIVNCALEETIAACRGERDVACIDGAQDREICDMRLLLASL